MRRAAIVSPIRTPVGKFLGALSSHPRRRAGRGDPQGAGGAHQDRSRADRRRDLRPGLRQRRGALHRPLVGPGGGPADLDSRLSARPALRQRPAGGDRRGDDGPDRRGRRGRRRRRREHEQRRILHHRHARRRARRLGDPARPPGPRAGDEPADRPLRRDQRHDRDRRQPRPRLPDLPRGLRRVRRRQPPARGRGLGEPASSTTSWCRSPCRRSGAIRWSSPATRACAPTPRAESLGKLKPLEKDGVVTAGNASQQNDAAAACLVVAEDKLEELGLEPMGWMVGWAAAGCEPSRMGIGPVPAVERLFARTGMSWDDIGLVELNEAFAPQVLAVLKGWGWDDRDRLNVNGSGISPRPSDRRDRRADPRQSAARDEAARRAVRPGDDVHRRRPGHRRGVRGGVIRTPLEGLGRALRKYTSAGASRSAIIDVRRRPRRPRFVDVRSASSSPRARSTCRCSTTRSGRGSGRSMSSSRASWPGGSARRWWRATSPATWRSALADKPGPLGPAGLLLARRPAVQRHGDRAGPGGLAADPAGRRLQDLSPAGHAALVDEARRSGGWCCSTATRASAKTEMLSGWRRWASQTLDLEGLAAHRGSLFGALAGRRPSPPEAVREPARGRARPLDPSRPIVVEAESSKVGELNVPPTLWKAMRPRRRSRWPRRAEARARYLVRTYADIDADAAGPDRRRWPACPGHHGKADRPRGRSWPLDRPDETPWPPR